MRSGGEAAESEWRESAAFDVAIADYRRAFALAIASEGGRAPRFWPLLLRAAWQWGRWGLALALLGGSAWVAYRYRGAEALLRTGREALAVALHIAAVAMPTALLIGAIEAWSLSSRRRHFPEHHAAWKRPTRMRVRWNDAALVRAGTQGFGSFAWTGLHAWLEAPETLVVFTAMLDPVPIPHAALAPGDLDDLRARLARAEVPAAWKAMSARQQGLRRVFR